MTVWRPLRHVSRLAIAAAAIISLAFVAACGQQTSQDRPLIVGGPKNIAMLVIVAEKRGLFKAANVQVEYRPLQTGKIAQDALISGDIDMGVLVDSNIAFTGFQTPEQIRVLATITEKSDDAIVARRDRAINAPSDLAGKTIGYLPATTSHLFLARFLAAKGVPISSVKLLGMPPPAMQAAITRGDVDAVSMWQPFRFNALKTLGANGVEFRDPSAYMARALIAGRTGYVTEHRAVAERFLSALVAAEQYVAQNSEAAIALLAPEVGIDKEVLTAIWGEYNLQVRLDTSLLTLLNEEGAWISATQDGFIGKPVPDYRRMIWAEPIRAVDPARASIP